MYHSKEAVSDTAYLNHATGEMQFKLTNDYLFRAVLQKNTKALKGLISAVLGLDPEEIVSCEIQNPIELGDSIDAKYFILDIRVLLNSDVTINLEMQVVNQGNWSERSLAYLCRSFDSLNVGQDYMEIKPVIQICFLDFTLFQEYPEFFSTYMFMNVKNYVIYSDKLKLLIVDLTQIHNATEEDKIKGIDHWARLFKATTWEEVKMLAVNNDYIHEAAETACRLLTEEEKIRMRCEAREDYYRQQRYIQYRLEKAEKIEENAERIEREFKEAVAENESLAAENIRLKAMLEELLGKK